MQSTKKTDSVGSPYALTAQFYLNEFPEIVSQTILEVVIVPCTMKGLIFSDPGPQKLESEDGSASFTHDGAIVTPKGCEATFEYIYELYGSGDAL